VQDKNKSYFPSKLVVKYVIWHILFSNTCNMIFIIFHCITGSEFDEDDLPTDGYDSDDSMSSNHELTAPLILR
jgi:hypothetical protein